MANLTQVNTNGYFTKVYHNVKKLQGITGRFTTDRKLVLSNLIQKYENLYENKGYKDPHTRKDNPYHFCIQQKRLCEELTITRKGMYKIMQFLQKEGYIKYFSTNKEGYIYKATYVYIDIEFLNKKIEEISLSLAVNPIEDIKDATPELQETIHESLSIPFNEKGEVNKESVDIELSQEKTHPQEESLTLDSEIIDLDTQYELAKQKTDNYEDFRFTSNQLKGKVMEYNGKDQKDADLESQRQEIGQWIKRIKCSNDRHTPEQVINLIIEGGYYSKWEENFSYKKRNKTDFNLFITNIHKANNGELTNEPVTDYIPYNPNYVITAKFCSKFKNDPLYKNCLAGWLPKSMNKEFIEEIKKQSVNVL